MKYTKFIIFLTFIILFLDIFYINSVFAENIIEERGYLKTYQNDNFPYIRKAKIEGGGIKYLHTNGTWFFIDIEDLYHYQETYETDEDFHKRVNLGRENNEIGYLKLPGGPAEIILKNRTRIIEGEIVYTRSNGTRFFLSSTRHPETQQIRESDSEFIERIKERHKERMREEKPYDSLGNTFLFIFGFIITFFIYFGAGKGEGISSWIRAAIITIGWLGFAMLFRESSPGLSYGVFWATVIFMILGLIIFLINPKS